MAVAELPSITAYRTIIQDLLEKSVEIKDTGSIEPSLTEADLGPFVDDVVAKRSSLGEPDNAQAHYAAVETVVRERFYDLLASTSIDEPAFGQIWNLLDIVSIVSDHELCEPGLIFWLVEELLDSQTIEGCGIVFDFLESRREQITARHFKQKSLIVLRSCNELLRRLSRAEDTVFCGRVFIFMFQSFPLGDKSSVNLRGEFHTENVTTFDEIGERKESEDPVMDGDAGQSMTISGAPATQSTGDTARPKSEGSQTGKTVNFDASVTTSEAAIDLNLLYPVFWGLQADFSAPTRLFDASQFSSFKKALEVTMKCFQAVPASAGPAVRSQDDNRRSTKRKRSIGSSEVSSTFNPKYLTNRDLFELEIHDVAFRRHILVQALIVLDFLLSLTPAAKSKLVSLTNKSVLYSFTLSDADTAWASTTKLAIANYLQQGSSNEGKFYYRMVDTVLSRDKNWVRWKAENCPEIHRAPVTTDQHQGAQAALGKLCKTHDLRQPLDALDLGFLTKDSGLEGLKNPLRFSLPGSESFYDGIRADELDAEMGTDDEMQFARDARETKIWKALRASKHRFQLCESIDNGKNLTALSGETSAAPALTTEEFETPGAGE